jgi:transposase InsO family protein
MHSEDLVVGIETRLYRCKDFPTRCDACARGKKTKLPFTQRTSAPARIFEHVHVDTVGEITVTAQGGERYFVTMVDGFSGYCDVCPVHLKSQIPHVVIGKLREWERHTGEKVQVRRSDRGMEFLNKDVKGFCLEEGVVMETCVPYTPEQNGVAEQTNRTVKEKARTMLVGCNADGSLRANTVVFAAYLQNLVPESGRSKTPWEHISDLKWVISVWRCLAHAKKKKHQVTTFASSGRLAGGFRRTHGWVSDPDA